MEAQDSVTEQDKAMESGIKLKIKMKTRDAAEGEVVSPTVSGCSTGGEDVPIEHESKLCEKSLSSGRALEAHTRTQSGTAAERCSSNPCSKIGALHGVPRPSEQQERQKIHPTTDVNMGTDDDSGEAEADSKLKKKPNAVCVLCKKEFPSMKSLFGHMRCHPGREWRGIQPPEKFQSSPSSTVSDSEPNFLAASSEKTESRIGSWRKRRKRNRTEALLAENDGARSNDSIFDAAYSLLVLKNGKNPAKIDPSVLRSVVSEQEEDGHGCKTSNKKKRTKQKKIRALMDRSEKHRCNICHKAFSSHQALGGHRASHTKTKEEFLDAETGDKDAFEPAEEPLSSEFDAKEVPAHECKICHKFFPSGRALGGHKRCHWNEDRAAVASIVLEAAESSSMATFSAEQKRAPAEQGFDLNEVAPLEDADLDVLYSMVDVVPAAAKLLGFEAATSNVAYLVDNLVA
ncbi:unnamed protein product [Victoria cruziana]